MSRSRHVSRKLLVQEITRNFSPWTSSEHVQETIRKFKDFGCALELPFSDRELVRTNHRQAPLRSSDRRKLKQRVIQNFSLDPDVGEDLVPDGLLSVKFETHTYDPGVSQSHCSLPCRSHIDESREIMIQRLGRISGTRWGSFMVHAWERQ